MKIFALGLCARSFLRLARSSLRLASAPIERSASACFCFNSCSRAPMRAAKLHPGQRDFAPLVLHLAKDAFLLSLLDGFFLPASRTHQHVAGSRVNIGQSDPLIAQDEFAHLVGGVSYRAI